MKLKQITIGTDPEMFLFDKSTGEFKSAIGLIPGSKEEPYHPEDLDDGFGLQTDNVLVEFNVPAVKLEHEHKFIGNIVLMKRYIQNLIAKFNENYTIKCQASAYLPMTELCDPQACLFGCDPDYNCYTRMQNPAPVIDEITLRSAGFHWHVGFENPTLRDCIKLIRYMDLFMGIPSVLMDSDTKRRSLYGKAGAFRLQKYGVEWRVLSSHFLDTPELITFMYKQLLRAIKAFEDNEPLPTPSRVVRTINKSNTEYAKQLIEEFKITNELF